MRNKTSSDAWLTWYVHINVKGPVVVRDTIREKIETYSIIESWNHRMI